MTTQRFDLKDSREAPARRHLSWRGFCVEHVVPASGDSFAYQWQSNLHFCALHDILLKDGGIQAGSDREITQKDLRSSLTYVPKGADVRGWSDLTERRNSYVAIYFDPGDMHEELDQRFPEDWRVRLYFRDPELSASLRRFSKLLALGEGADDLFAETLGLMTVLNLQRTTADQPATKPALSRRTSSRVVEYVDANLGNQISLEDLAATAGLSRFHFNRAFKAATGESPYQYVLRRRIETAQALLAERGSSVEQVAAAVGFRNASHFQKVFKARVGLNPSDFARLSEGR
ncbi:MAG: AraC family transcriptional regulator [Hoeflea sp.]|nr:AraC family transcriptional regulator [Hoeflea sp.]MDP3526529.1 AraC family transcriptional regulator [Hoeflea sp.]